MITASDSFFTYDLGKYYVIIPQTTTWNVEEFKKNFNAEIVPEGFCYDSGTNTEWETIDSLRELIIEHVDPNFIA